MATTAAESNANAEPNASRDPVTWAAANKNLQPISNEYFPDTQSGNSSDEDGDYIPKRRPRSPSAESIMTVMTFSAYERDGMEGSDEDETDDFEDFDVHFTGGLAAVKEADLGLSDTLVEEVKPSVPPVAPPVALPVAPSTAPPPAIKFITPPVAPLVAQPVIPPVTLPPAPPIIPQPPLPRENLKRLSSTLEEMRFHTRKPVLRLSRESGIGSSIHSSIAEESLPSVEEEEAMSIMEAESQPSMASQTNDRDATQRALQELDNYLNQLNLDVMDLEQLEADLVSTRESTLLSSHLTVPQQRNHYAYPDPEDELSGLVHHLRATSSMSSLSSLSTNGGLHPVPSARRNPSTNIYHTRTPSDRQWYTPSPISHLIPSPMQPVDTPSPIRHAELSDHDDEELFGGRAGYSSNRKALKTLGIIDETSATSHSPQQPKTVRRSRSMSSAGSLSSNPSVQTVYRRSTTPPPVPGKEEARGSVVASSKAMRTLGIGQAEGGSSLQGSSPMASPAKIRQSSLDAGNSRNPTLKEVKHTAIIGGFHSKQSSKKLFSRTSWKRRYYILTPTHIFCFRSDADHEECCGTLALEGCEVFVATDLRFKGRAVLEIRASASRVMKKWPEVESVARSWFLLCDGQEVLVRWLREIKAVISGEGQVEKGKAVRDSVRGSMLRTREGSPSSPVSPRSQREFPLRRESPSSPRRESPQSPRRESPPVNAMRRVSEEHGRGGSVYLKPQYNGSGSMLPSPRSNRPLRPILTSHSALDLSSGPQSPSTPTYRRHHNALDSPSRHHFNRPLPYEPDRRDSQFSESTISTITDTNSSLASAHTSRTSAYYPSINRPPSRSTNTYASLTHPQQQQQQRPAQSQQHQPTLTTFRAMNAPSPIESAIAVLDMLERRRSVTDSPPLVRRGSEDSRISLSDSITTTTTSTSDAGSGLRVPKGVGGSPRWQINPGHGKRTSLVSVGSDLGRINEE
ncbi:hypothetical protein HK097_011431 [Rhizophlyctis rosea]|uniref:PH domain-containing protein n=1 Tax=Rhizophlyctis rosea TaxID=64517 RepID=A0AAD5X3S9_9FUNG|nr:hypothetical protein HK097_011431 [Rhizophlyctis rosea]